jgi:L-ascorbate metabolism protein UlaG (beta-lactamase superfamily)
MFDIDYKGGNTVIISTKKATLVFNPKLSLVGLKDIVMKDAVELSTEDRFAVKNDDAKLKISVPGEYGVGDVDIKVISARRHIDTEDQAPSSVIFKLSIGDSRIAVLGNVFSKLSDDQLEEIGLVDILIIPVGGSGYTLDAVSAAKLTAKIDPKVVIPIHYEDKDLKYEVPQESVDLFLKEINAPIEKVSKYKVKNGNVYPSSLTAVVLDRTS